MSDFFNIETVTIPAGKRFVKFSASGLVLSYIAGPSVLRFRPVGASGKFDDFDMLPGMERHYMPGGGYTEVSIFRDADDDASLALAVTVGCGTARIVDNRAVVDARASGAIPVREGASRLVGVALPSQQIAGNTSVTLAGAPSYGLLTRKALLVSNDDPANKLTILDGAGVPVLRVYPFTSVRLDVSGAVTVANQNPAACAATVGEIWHTA